MRSKEARTVHAAGGRGQLDARCAQCGRLMVEFAVALASAGASQ